MALVPQTIGIDEMLADNTYKVRYYDTTYNMVDEIRCRFLGMNSNILLFDNCVRILDPENEEPLNIEVRVNRDAIDRIIVLDNNLQEIMVPQPYGVQFHVIPNAQPPPDPGPLFGGARKRKTRRARRRKEGSMRSKTKCRLRRRLKSHRRRRET